MGRRWAIALLLAAGCGSLNAPDLATGEVTGRLTGAGPGAFVYALGAPETRVAVAADGSYTVRGVPVGSAQLVLFDGGGRAEAVPVEVKAASRAQAPDRDVGSLAAARTVLAVVRPAGDVSPAGTTTGVDGAVLVDVDGTARVEVTPVGGVARLYPLPPGVYTVRSRARGLQVGEQTVDVSTLATARLELSLGVDDGDERRGCVSNGCVGDLRCSDDDSHDSSYGRCYPCNSDLQCGPGYQCTDHRCLAPLPGGSHPSCAPCVADGDCAAGPGGVGSQPGRCVVDVASGAHVCSRGCSSDVDCPSGMACGVAADGRRACLAPRGCGLLPGAFGVTCMEREECALADPECVRVNGTPGYCSSRCSAPEDCPTSLGLVCDMSRRLCTRP